MRQGLILLAHGARDPRWREPFEELARRVQVKCPEVDVRLAFLDWMKPDVPTAGDEAVAAGCDTLRIVPVFLGQGGHVREDVPALIAALRARHPAVIVTQSGAAGEDSTVLDALAAFCVYALGLPSH
jgi:sirohydrochlorin cobaltochelatase